jgi:restriction system protein
MDLDESPLLHEPDLMLAVLRVGTAKSGTLDDCISHLRLLRACAEIDEPLPEAELRARLRAAQAKLERAGLIEASAPGRFRITARGREILADNPGGVDETVLMPLREFRGSDGHAGAQAAACSASTGEQASAVDYHRGYEANLGGANLADNPHPPDVRAYLDWENGWSQACDDRLRQRRRFDPERWRPNATGARRRTARASGRSP